MDSLFFRLFLLLLTLKGTNGQAQLSAPSRAAMKTSSPPSTLVVYDYTHLVGPHKNLVTAASPSGNATNLRPEFGSIYVFSTVLREDKDGISPEIGRLNGQSVVLNDVSLSSTYTAVINTTRFRGTITIQGMVDNRINGELAVTGGTGDFRWARGYVETQHISYKPENLVIKNTFHLRYN